MRISGDLIKFLNWPLGSVVAQACHATTAVNHVHRDDPETVAYFSDLDNMHKVVLMVRYLIRFQLQDGPNIEYFFQADDEESLKTLSENLTEESIKHKLWVEQPENIVTCLAIKPYLKETVFPFVKAFKLLK